MESEFQSLHRENEENKKLIEAHQLTIETQVQTMAKMQTHIDAVESQLLYCNEMAASYLQGLTKLCVNLPRFIDYKKKENFIMFPLFADAIDEVLKSKGDKLDADASLRLIDGVNILKSHITEKVVDKESFSTWFNTIKEDKRDKIDKQVRQEITSLTDFFDELQ